MTIETCGSISPVCLGYIEVFERHTTVNIQNWILEQLAAYKITDQQLLGSSNESDCDSSEAEPLEANLAVMVQEEFEAEFDIFPATCIRVHCAAHILQLGICDFSHEKEATISRWALHQGR